MKVVVVGPSYVDYSHSVGDAMVLPEQRLSFLLETLQKFDGNESIDSVLEKINSDGFEMPELVLGHSVKTLKTESLPGGPGLSYAVALHLLGFETVLCSAVGHNDVESSLIRSFLGGGYKESLLPREGIPTIGKYLPEGSVDFRQLREKYNGIAAYLQTSENLSSDTTNAIISPAGDRFIASQRHASEGFRFDETVKKHVDEADVVVVTTYDPKVNREIIDYARDKFIVQATNFRNAKKAQVLRDVAQYINLIPLEEIEYKEMAKHLDGQLKDTVIAVTKGKSGGYIAVNGHKIQYECFPECLVTPTDTNHAGESFGSGFFYGLFADNPGSTISKQDICRAAQYGAINACLNIQKEGIGFSPEEVLKKIMHSHYK